VPATGLDLGGARLEVSADGAPGAARRPPLRSSSAGMAPACWPRARRVGPSPAPRPASPSGVTVQNGAADGAGCLSVVNQAVTLTSVLHAPSPLAPLRNPSPPSLVPPTGSTHYQPHSHLQAQPSPLLMLRAAHSLLRSAVPEPSLTPHPHCCLLPHTPPSPPASPPPCPWPLPCRDVKSRSCTAGGNGGALSVLRSPRAALTRVSVRASASNAAAASSAQGGRGGSVAIISKQPAGWQWCTRGSTGAVLRADASLAWKPSLFSDPPLTVLSPKP